MNLIRLIILINVIAPLGITNFIYNIYMYICIPLYVYKLNFNKIILSLI